MSASDEYSRTGAIEESPPQVLFKFRRFPSLQGLTDGRLEDAKWQREQVFRTFRGQLTLAKPEGFNDPFEFMPAVAVVHGSPRERQERAKKRVWATIRNTLPFKQRLEVLRNPGQVARVADNLRELTLASLRQLRNDVELYCVTASESRPLLWSHYADGHRGIALHFDGTRAPFNAAWRVQYTREYPTILADREHSPDENWNNLRASLLVKDKDWSYEDEWRVLAPLSAGSIDLMRLHGVVHKEGCFFVDPKVVLGVTLGAMMPADAESDLLAFLAAERPNVIVRRARMADARFEIEVQS